MFNNICLCVLKFSKNSFFLTFLLLFTYSNVYSFESFEVEDIRIEGIQRISAGTVFNYFPIKVGEQIDNHNISKALHELFKTGFFKDVRIEAENNILIISVVERPAISTIEFEGNKDIETEELTKSLKQVGFAEGRVYDKSLLDKVVEELRRQYYSRGKYAVRIESVVTPLERNRVGITVNVSEGKVSKIKKINIVGNTSFDEETILDEMELTTPTLFSFYTKKDQYSKQRLSGDLEKIRAFYMDRGYVNFSIDSTQVSITPDKKDVYITVNIVEGAQYSISDVKIAGDLILPKEELFKLVKIRKNQIFSRKKVTRTSESIVEALGKEGYAFSNVNPIPEINDETNTITLTFFIDPGNRVYVRRVNIYGNTNTADHVVRRELRQQESAWISTTKVQRGKQRLNKLGYFKDVSVETPAIPGKTDLVDVNYTLEEQSTGSINAGIGFSQTDGIIFNFSISQQNFLGTGNSFSVGVNTSKVNRLLHLSVTDPYWTQDGVSRTWYVTHRRTDAEENNLSNYTVNKDALGLNFGFPVNEFNRYNLGMDIEKIKIKLPSDLSDTADNIIDFVQHNGGDDYLTLRLQANWAHDSRNKAIFPDRGSLLRIKTDIATPGSEYQFFHLGYKQVQYFPVSKQLTVMLKGDIGIGDIYAGDVFPPFENYYAGGMNSVRGFKDNTLGPIDAKTDRAIGGRLRTVANAELIMPIPFVKDSAAYRLSGFFDIGNVYESLDNFAANELRYSTGISGAWVSPFGLLRFSLGYPINDKDGDETQIFQFSFGQQF
ncbi:MAG: outer membrane protein assembly factor BamA [Pseudomonadota bacterium]